MIVAAFVVGFFHFVLPPNSGEPLGKCAALMQSYSVSEVHAEHVANLADICFYPPATWRVLWACVHVVRRHNFNDIARVELHDD